MCDGNRERSQLHNRLRDEIAYFGKAMHLRGVRTEQSVDDASLARNDVQVEAWNSVGGPLGWTS